MKVMSMLDSDLCLKNFLRKNGFGLFPKDLMSLISKFEPCVMKTSARFRKKATKKAIQEVDFYEIKKLVIFCGVERQW